MFYETLERLEVKIGGRKLLMDCNGRMAWPKRGVYFFMENGEVRTDSGTGPRIVRIGTHALNTNSNATMWKRLLQHKGSQKSGGGNHRKSVFRLIVGTALDKNHPTWELKKSVDIKIRHSEISLEKTVSQTIRSMPFLWLPVDDTPGPGSLRKYIEINSIGLLSNFKKNQIDSPSSTWLGNACTREHVRLSGLWNKNHVSENYDPDFLSKLNHLVNDI